MSKGKRPVHQRVKFKIQEQYQYLKPEWADKVWVNIPEQKDDEEVSEEGFRLFPTGWGQTLERLSPRCKEADEEKTLSDICEENKYEDVQLKFCCEVCGRWRAKQGHTLNLKKVKSEQGGSYIEKYEIIRFGTKPIQCRNYWENTFNEADPYHSMEKRHKRRICAECYTFPRWQAKMRNVKEELNQVIHGNGAENEGHYFWGVRYDYLKGSKIKSDPLYFTGWKWAWASFYSRPDIYSVAERGETLGDEEVATTTELNVNNALRQKLYPGTKLINLCKEIDEGTRFEMRHNAYKRDKPKNLWSGIVFADDYCYTPMMFYRTQGKTKPDYERYKKAVLIIERAYFNARTPLGEWVFNKMLEDTGVAEHY